MSDTSKPNKPILRRARPVPTLLTVPDLRETLMSSSISDEQTHAVVSPADEMVDLSASSVVAGAAGPPDELAAMTVAELAPHAASSLDDLVSASEAQVVAVDETKSLASKAKSAWKEGWFTGNFRLDMSTVGTIAVTVAACALVAGAMKPRPVSDGFAVNSGIATKMPAENPPLEVAQVPPQQPVGQQTLGSPQQPHVQRLDVTQEPQQPDPRMMRAFIDQQQGVQPTAGGPTDARLPAMQTQAAPYARQQPTPSANNFAAQTPGAPDANRGQMVGGQFTGGQFAPATQATNGAAAQNGAMQNTAPQLNPSQANFPQLNSPQLNSSQPGNESTQEVPWPESNRGPAQVPQPQQGQPYADPVHSAGATIQSTPVPQNPQSQGYPSTSAAPFAVIASGINKQQPPAAPAQVADQRNASFGGTARNRFEQNTNQNPNNFSGGASR